MPFRVLTKLWEWVLLFSPAVIVLLATAYDVYFVPRGGRMLVGLDGAVIGACFAVPLCFVVGFVFTTPQPQWYQRAAWSLVMSLAVLVLNSAIAFAGCMATMR